jgi:hypothetical protein
MARRGVLSAENEDRYLGWEPFPVGLMA